MKMIDNIIPKEYITQLDPSILQKLRIIKQCKGCSFKQIARGTGLSKAQLVMIWNGQYDPTPKAKELIAKYFEANPLELWKVEDERV